MMEAVEQDRLCARLDELIRAAAPDAKLVPKYGGTLYTLYPQEKEGQFCGVFAYKDHVQMAFAHGAALDDKTGLLGGTGKFRRHVSYAAVSEIDEARLSSVLDEAVAHARALGKA